MRVSARVLAPDLQMLWCCGSFFSQEQRQERENGEQQSRVEKSSPKMKCPEMSFSSLPSSRFPLALSVRKLPPKVLAHRFLGILDLTGPTHYNCVIRFSRPIDSDLPALFPPL